MGKYNRIRYAQNLADKGKRDEILYNQDKGTQRTGSEPGDMKYMDCSEFVNRVMAHDGITKKVEAYNTDGLKQYFKESGKFERSANNNPQPGDIYLKDGHTGIVKSFDQKTGVMNTLEAIGHHKNHPGVPHDVGERSYKSYTKNGEKVSQFQNLINDKSFQGFWHPKTETPDTPDNNQEQEKQGDKKEQRHEFGYHHKPDPTLWQQFVEKAMKTAKEAGVKEGELSKLLEQYKKEHEQKKNEDADNKKEKPDDANDSPKTKLNEPAGTKDNDQNKPKEPERKDVTQPNNPKDNVDGKPTDQPEVPQGQGQDQNKLENTAFNNQGKDNSSVNTDAEKNLDSGAKTTDENNNRASENAAFANSNGNNNANNAGNDAGKDSGATAAQSQQQHQQQQADAGM